MLKILFCSLKNEYGRPERGPSFEYTNFYETLTRMADVEVKFFPTDVSTRELGRDGMNQSLIKKVLEDKPDLLFCFILGNELKRETIRYITTKTTTKTFNWFGDDHWRFWVFSRHWAPWFTMVSTTDSEAYTKYQALGINNVIKTQWAANHFLFYPQDSSRDSNQYHITFLGQAYGTRRGYIKALQEQGLPAQGIGYDWGRPNTVQEMLDVFSFSKINLNFTETPYVDWRKELFLFSKLVLKDERMAILKNPLRIIDAARAAYGARRSTIKGRTFQAPACGGFQITGKADGLEEYYDEDKEIVVFKDTDDLVEKCRYYLEHEDQREKIAKAGYYRTIQEHTYEQRFRQIFQQMNLQ